MIRYIWKLVYRLTYVAILFVGMTGFFIWNYSLLNFNFTSYGTCLLNNAEKQVCANNVNPILICGEKAIPSNRVIVLPIIGALFFQFVSLGYRCSYYIKSYISDFRTNDIKYDGLHRICLYGMMLFITIIQSIAAVFTQTNVFGYSCKDFLGVESTPYYWIDWICTVPLIFFLVSMVDVDSLNFHISEVTMEALGGGSIMLQFLTNFPFPFYINVLLFTASNICMASAVIWQYHLSKTVYLAEYSRYGKIPLCKRREAANRSTFELYQRAENKLNCSLYVCLVFPIFPVLYFLRVYRIIDLETYTSCMLILKHLSKVLFLHVLTMMHSEAFDPSKLKLIEQKKDLENSRMAFLRFILHQIRGPLNAIALGLQVLTESSELVNSHEEIITTIREGINYMTDTLKDVIYLQKIEEGLISLELASFKPDSLLSSALKSFQTQLNSKNVKVLVQIFKDVPAEIYDDQHRLQHVMNNLLSNAIKFCPDNSDICLSLSYETKITNSVTFAVRDHGPGISEEDKQQLFKPFMQVRPGELQKGRGSGLGLSICKHMIELHGGSIDCVSIVRQNAEDVTTGGTEFSFTVPVNFNNSDSKERPPPSKYKENTMIGIMSMEMESKLHHLEYQDKWDQDRGSFVVNALNMMTKEHRVTSEQSRITDLVNEAVDVAETVVDTLMERHDARRKERILIVEDVQSNLKMLRLLLKHRGFVLIDHCSNGREAVDHVSEKGNDFYHLIFLDNLMPVMCGIEAATLLRSNGFINPIVGLTGNAMTEEVSEFETSGVDIVITKIMGVESLDRILQYCDQRRAKGVEGQGQKVPKKTLKQFLGST